MSRLLSQMEAVSHRFEELSIRLNQPETAADPALFRRLMQEYHEAEPVVQAYQALITAQDHLAQAKALLEGETLDPDFKEMVQQEIGEKSQEVAQLENNLKILLLPKDVNDDKSVIMELRGGAGGEEAALFAHSLMRMYTMYVQSRGWELEVLNLNETELGGVKEAILAVNGAGAYNRLKYESGVHRVQRVPETEIADNVNFHEIAKAASGASGAELANIVNEAALRAVRDGRRFATQADLEESIEVVIAGYQKKSRVLSEKEKLIVSYHEVGHALVAALQTNSAPVHKITIIPRTSGALGYTMQVEEGERFLMSKEEMANKIATLTGGRAAEEIIFHSITTGASNDIEQATKLARAMITRYGMSDTFDMVAMETVANQYLGGDSSLSCSPETQTQIDTLTVDLVKAQHQKAIQLLQDNLPKLHEIAKYLYEHETITGEEFMTILMRKSELAAADSAASGN